MSSAHKGGLLSGGRQPDILEVSKEEVSSMSVSYGGYGEQFERPRDLHCEPEEPGCDPIILSKTK